MLGQPNPAANYPAQRLKHRVGFSLAGIALILPGLGLLSVSLWMLLAELRDPLFASTVLGGLYVGLGLICLGLARRRPRHPVPPPPAARGLGPELVSALLQGVSAGMAARASMRPPPRP
ncbi:Putative Holin-X, holin superfamily III [Pseudooceanicola antarcticus]|uniref:Putative Holin-X, holin superfamily III n=1 Tax=Pseudooceanicola antarcticus TaxID=1247613 RepID=A0A285JH59_9RHOB|nr:phage holin family protein [Pseudooceanicola antarcticus]PJE26451.1 hypothetical protein CVM39_18080 [Pseudooceanicola antarcticus]SNY59612.1 Putative Holin-X, holin superfamily III [Pseudooceanicola antarcticus]